MLSRFPKDKEGWKRVAVIAAGAGALFVASDAVFSVTSYMLSINFRHVAWMGFTAG